MAGLMIAIGKPKSGKGGGYDADLEAAAGELIAAVKAGDAAGVASALKASHAICGSMDSEGPEESEE